MALTLNNLVGFETQGNEEASSTQNSPTAETTVVHEPGEASVNLSNTNQEFLISAIETGTVTSGDSRIFSFWFFWPSLTGATNVEFCSAIGSTKIWLMRTVTPASNTLLQFEDNAATTYNGSTTITVNAWHLLQILWDNTATGDVDVWLDGVSEISETSIDLDTGTLVTDYRLQGIRSGPAYYDDVLSYTGATGTGDFLADYSIKKYQAKGTSLTENGTALTTGSWDATGDTPLVEDADGTAAEYAGGSEEIGDVTTDAGSETDIGPSTDSDVGDVLAAKWVHRLKRDNGSGTTHGVQIGNSGDGISGFTVTLIVTYGNFLRVNTLSSVAPEANEFFRQGFGKSSGGREVFCAEMWAMALVTPPVDDIGPEWIQSQSQPVIELDEMVAY